jgi:DNA-binding MarR family transcriptional regulator
MRNRDYQRVVTVLAEFAVAEMGEHTVEAIAKTTQLREPAVVRVLERLGGVGWLTIRRASVYAHLSGQQRVYRLTPKGRNAAHKILESAALLAELDGGPATR